MGIRYQKDKQTQACYDERAALWHTHLVKMKWPRYINLPKNGQGLKKSDLSALFGRLAGGQHLTVQRIEKMELLDVAFVFEVDGIIAGEAGIAEAGLVAAEVGEHAFIG